MNAHTESPDPASVPTHEIQPRRMSALRGCAFTGFKLIFIGLVLLLGLLTGLTRL